MADGTTIQTSCETITPDIAREMLGHNEGNRNVNRRHVNELAREMENGEWTLNGESLKFGTSGKLLDGQHRLLAVIQSNTTIQTLVSRGLPDKTQETIDTGRARTLNDVLRLRDELSSTQLAAVLRAVYVANELGLEAAAEKSVDPTRGELLEFLEKTPQIHTVTNAAQSFQKNSKGLLTPSMFAALWWELAHKDVKAANEFFVALESGNNLEKNDPILCLRNTLFAAKASGARSDRHSRRRTAALVVKAWNKWRRGEQIVQLRFGMDEKFPEAI